MTARRPSGGAAGFRGWRALRHRNYRLFFTGQGISLVGTWMQTVAQSWLVLQLTGSPFMLGLVAVAQFLPVLVLGLFGGLIADGLPKRRTLIATQSIQMVLAFVLFGLVVSGAVQVWMILVLCLLLGLTNAIDMPTRQSFAVEMVGREDVGNAVALNSALFNAARIIGPAIAGLVIGAFDISVAFLVNGVSFLAVIGAYWLMRDDELRSPPPLARPTTVAAVRANLGEGLRYVRWTPLVLMPVLVVGLVSTFGMNFSVIIPALARDVLHTDAAGYGFLMAASGVGSLISALSLAVAGRPHPSLIAIGAFVLGLAEVGTGLVHSYPLAVVLMFAVGLGGIAMAATANTVIQLAVPDGLRGRVMSVYTTVFAGSTPIGGLLMGGLADTAGVEVSLVVAGALCAGLGAGAWIWLGRIVRTRKAAAMPAGVRLGLEEALVDEAAATTTFGRPR